MFGYIEGSFLVIRTYDTRERYMLLNTYLCNHILLQSGGGTWDTVLYTVRGVGSESRDVDGGHDTVSVHRGSGAPSFR